MAEPLAYEAHGLRGRRGGAAGAARTEPRSASAPARGSDGVLLHAFVFAYFYLRSLNTAGCGSRRASTTSIGLGHRASSRAFVAAAVLIRLGPRRPSRRRAASSGASRARSALALRLAGSCPPGRRVDDAGFGPPTAATRASSSAGRRFLFLFVLGDAVLARDDPRDVAPLPRGSRTARRRPVRPPATRTAWVTTSAIRSRSSAQSSVGLASTDLPRRDRRPDLDHPLPPLSHVSACRRSCLRGRPPALYGFALRRAVRVDAGAALARRRRASTSASRRSSSRSSRPFDTWPTRRSRCTWRSTCCCIDRGAAAARARPALAAHVDAASRDAPAAASHAASRAAAGRPRSG